MLAYFKSALGGPWMFELPKWLLILAKARSLLRRILNTLLGVQRRLAGLNFERIAMAIPSPSTGAIKVARCTTGL